jgi:2-polyprenyl-3-methyl-5-hydroxy-6-metoxy-1,4-benzoquinol methylase
MNYHKFFIDNTDPEDTVLDIGCGNGALSFDIAKKAVKVVGIDSNKKNIEFAKQRFSASNIEYVVGDAVKELPNKRFDIIILSNVLEHIENRIEFLNRIKSLAPKILIRVPMLNRDWITLYKKELGVEWKLDKSHYAEYTLKSFKQELKKAGLFIKEYSIQFGEIWSIIIQ